MQRARQLEAWPLPDWAVSLLTDRGFHTGAAKFIVLTELFIAVGLWWRGTRYAAVWVAVAFHVAHRGVGIGTGLLVSRHRRAGDLGGAVHPRSGAPHRPDRRVATGGWRALVRGLDWLARFRVEPAPPGSRLEVVDRDGTTFRGAPAVAFALSRLPLTAWFALPALLLPAVRRARRGANDDRGRGDVTEATYPSTPGRGPPRAPGGPA